MLVQLRCNRNKKVVDIERCLVRLCDIFAGALQLIVLDKLKLLSRLPRPL